MSKHGPKLKRLVNLLGRGRNLHYENAKALAARSVRLRLPPQPPLLAELVYQAVQLVFALTFLEERGYLSEAEYDPFTDALFARVTGAHGTRVHGLIDNYAAALHSPAAFARTVASDLSAALIGKVDPAFVEALSSTPRAMMRTTQLYCAMTFNDRAMVDKLQ